MQGSKRQALYEIVKENVFKHAQTKDKSILNENGEFKVQNLVTKSKMQEQAKKASKFARDMREI